MGIRIMSAILGPVMKLVPPGSTKKNGISTAPDIDEDQRAKAFAAMQSLARRIKDHNPEDPFVMWVKASLKDGEQQTYERDEKLRHQEECNEKRGGTQQKRA